MTEPICEIDYSVDQFGTKRWYLNDKLHRVDGPAAEYASSTKYWYLNGKLHRVDGPALEWSDGTKEWWLNGEYYTFENWKVKVRKYYETQEDYLLLLLKL